jgi:hypothetical protein
MQVVKGRTCTTIDSSETLRELRLEAIAISG